MRKCAVLGAACLAGIWSGSVALAGGIATSGDNFVYQGLPALNMFTVGLGDIMATGRSGSGHTTQSLIRFDLSGVSLSQGDAAKLRLYVRDNVPDPNSGAPQFGVAPTPAFPITVDVSLAGSNWNQNTVTWLTRPSATSLVASNSITGINQWVEWDITSAVQGWIANPASNLGLVVTAPAVVTPEPGQTVYAIFNSSRNTAGNAPQITILNAIPEPSSLGLLAGTLVLGMRRRPR